MMQRWPATGLALLALALAACGGSAPESQAPAMDEQSAATSAEQAAPPPLPQEAAPTEPDAATSGQPEAPTTTAPEAAEAARPAVAVKTDFTPTDPATVQLASGQPQLVEFYADW